MLTWCYYWWLSWPNPCSNSISHCSYQNKPWMWHEKIFCGLSKNILPHHEILCDVIKYFATSFNNIHMTEEYTKNIPWHGMIYIFKFLLVHFSKFASSCLLGCYHCCLSKYDLRLLSTHVPNQRLNMRVWFRIYTRLTLVNILEPILVGYQLLNLLAWSLNWVY
jgi:hypothetical protein